MDSDQGTQRGANLSDSDAQLRSPLALELGLRTPSEVCVIGRPLWPQPHPTRGAGEDT